MSTLNNKSILITGGAGFIGSHLTHWLIENQYQVTVFDNLSTGHRESVKNARFVYGDIGNCHDLSALFSRFLFDAVIHLAGSSCVNDSISHPEHYYKNNYLNSLLLLETMQQHGVQRIIFSSSASVYGEPLYTPIDIHHPLNPINPYGKSKLLFEQALQHLSASSSFQHVSLRYFNAAGANPQHNLGEQHYPETHIIPLCLQVAAQRLPFLTIYGRDFNTPDGTAIRDYIHVQDIAEAHRLALEYLFHENQNHIFNLGTSCGTSIQQLLAAATHITGCAIPVIYANRRTGDPAQLVADASLAQKILGWQPRHSHIEQIIQDAWEWELKSNSTNTGV